MTQSNIKVVSIEDDESVQLMLETHFEDIGYQFNAANNLSAGLDAVKANHPDIVLLDINVAGDNGLIIIKDLKEVCNPIIIIVSGKTETSDRILGLEMGADDYLTKPFHLKELDLKIKSLLTLKSEANSNSPQNTSSSEESYQFDGWKLKPSEFTLQSPTGENVELTTGEFQLLEIFCQSPNRVLSREHLYDVTRGNNFESFDRALDVQIGRLRKKLKDDPKDSKYIKTVRGIGYQFCAKVEKA